jgi:hypothetical protein
MDGMNTIRPAKNAVVVACSSHPKKQTTVISTEAAHSIIVSSGVEKSASPPQPLGIARRAFAVQPRNALTFVFPSFPKNLPAI